MSIIVDELVGLTNAEAQRLCGVAHYRDPNQAMNRLVRANAIPHLRLGKRIRLSLPVLRLHFANHLAPQMQAATAEQNESPAVAA